MKQFRTVKRRAKVGERILITNKYDWEHRYKNGSVGEVLGFGVNGVFVQFEGVNAGVDHCEYEVIIDEVNPKEENEMETKRLTDYSYEELLDAIKAKAQAEVKPKLPWREVSDGLLARVNSHRTPQQQRDEIIEQAKRDVAELKSEKINGKGNGIYYYVDDPNNSIPWECYVEFIVNNEKRTVVALMRGRGTHIVRAKGIAKCAPTDCFNVYIGKAIALRRALGLEVPSEYLNAPQPTEVRVGDVIRGKYAGEGEGTYDLTIKSVGTSKYSYVEGGFDYINDSELRVIDDSREGE